MSDLSAQTDDGAAPGQGRARTALADGTPVDDRSDGPNGSSWALFNGAIRDLLDHVSGMPAPPSAAALDDLAGVMLARRAGVWPRARGLMPNGVLAGGADLQAFAGAQASEDRPPAGAANSFVPGEDGDWTLSRTAHAGISEGNDEGGATADGQGPGAIKSASGQPDVGATSLAPYDSGPGYHWDENGNLVAPTDTTSIEQGIADFGHDLLGPGIQGPNPNLGALSAGEESKGDPGAVSPGKGDHGGVSYGTYQFSTRERSPGGFIASSAGAPWRSDFAGLVPGSSAFSSMWKSVARKSPVEFAQAQYDYTKQTHYDPAIEDLKKATGIDFSVRSYALQDVIWSTAVQHSPDVAVDFVLKALAATKAKGLNPYQKIADRMIIEQIYAERGRPDGAGGLAHFHSSSASFQKNIAARFVREKAAAIKMLYGG